MQWLKAAAAAPPLACLVNSPKRYSRRAPGDIAERHHVRRCSPAWSNSGLSYAGCCYPRFETHIEDLSLQIAALLERALLPQTSANTMSRISLADIESSDITQRFCQLSLDLIDIGANLTHDSFAADLDAVKMRALQAGVRRQIVTGADLASSRQAAEMAGTRFTASAQHRRRSPAPCSESADGGLR